MYRYVKASNWAKSGGPARSHISKGQLTTFDIWSLHADAHDFASHSWNASLGKSKSDIYSRKVFASNMGHIAVVLVWISGMAFNGAYFSNYISWLKEPDNVVPSAHLVWDVVGQGLMNSDTGGFNQGLYITSGLFQVWLSQGFYSTTQLKVLSLTALSLSLLSLLGSFFHMHISSGLGTINFIKKFKVVLPHHLSILFGLGSISWSAHLIHISSPVLKLISAGVDPGLIPSPSNLLALKVRSLIDSENFSPHSNLSFVGSLYHAYQIEETEGSLCTTLVWVHHLSVGLCFLISGILFNFYATGSSASAFKSKERPLFLMSPRLSSASTAWNFNLSINLAFTSVVSLALAHQITFLPVYPHMSTDKVTSFCLFCHHSWISSFLVLGASSHMSIHVLAELFAKESYSASTYGASHYPFITKIISHRDLLLSHLVWVVIFLGFHSFGLYVHNDTLSSLGRLEDTFQDSSIQLKPFLSAVSGAFSLSGIDHATYSDYDIFYTGSHFRGLVSLLGTSDFLVNHIHAFTIHTTVLIGIKGTLYARSSRLVSDKSLLGFRYPCDGPGRGGTCQISPWDHLYLAAFWSYNSFSIIVFHYFWKMQSDVWTLRTDSSESSPSFKFLTSGDFSTNGTFINGWLRNFLWSQSSQVIQSYSSALLGFGLIFLISHFVWAFSLMFLFSGRGYWQELIESILWSHLKLGILPYLQPRALSISQGRAVGLCHFLVGGIGCTWSFTQSRLQAI
jgi:photosystem I P700 chlorophyll a apoprotein A1